MKRKDLLLLTFLLSQAVPVWAMDEPAPVKHIPVKTQNKDDPVQHGQNIQHSLLVMQREIGEYSQELRDGEKVFLLGRTMSGKSTLLNFLVGKKLFVNESGSLDTIDPIKGSEIGDGRVSTTTFPSLCQGPNNMVLCDFPGFGDSRGPEQDLIHAWARHKLFKGRFKILLAVEESDLGGGGDPFLQLMQDLTKTVPVAQLKESLALVVTKYGMIWKGNPHEKLKAFLTLNPEKSYRLTEDIRILLHHLTDEKNINTLIPFFPLQKVEGEYTSQDFEQKIFQAIKSVKFLEDPDVQLQLSPDSIKLIADLAKNLNEEIINSLSTLREKIIPLCAHMAKSWSTPGILEEMKRNVDTIRGAFKLLNDDTPKSIEEFTSSLKRFFGPDEPNIIHECVQTLSFLKKLTNEVTYSKAEWSGALQTTLKAMHEVVDELSKEIVASITRDVKTIVTPKIILFCENVMASHETDDKKLSILREGKDTVDKALAVFLENEPEHMNNFAGLFSKFFDMPEDNPLIHPMERLIFLKTFSKNKINFPTGDWLGSVQPSLDRIQILIREQEENIQQAKDKATKEKADAELAAAERKRLADLETQRLAQEEKARLEREEIERKAEEEHLSLLKALEIERQEAECRRIAAEEEARKAHEAAMARQKEEAAAQLKAQEEAARVEQARADAERRALEEKARVEREATAQRAAEQRQAEAAEMARLAAEAEELRKAQALLQQRMAADNQAREAAARDREAAAERELQRLADLEKQHKTQEAATAARLKAIEKKAEEDRKADAARLKVIEEKAAAEAAKMKSFEDKAVADRKAYLDELAAANATIKALLLEIPITDPAPQPQKIRTEITRRGYNKAIQQGATNVEAVDAPKITYWRKKGREITKEQYDIRVKDKKSAYMKPPEGKNYYRVTYK